MTFFMLVSVSSNGSSPDRDLPILKKNTEVILIMGQVLSEDVDFSADQNNLLSQGKT